MLTDAHFREYMRLLRRCRPWTKRRPPWFLFQMWLRRRPMNHEFGISPIADYLLSVGVSDEAIARINMRWPAWVVEFHERMRLMCDPLSGTGIEPPEHIRHALRPIEPTVRYCLTALDSMRGWTPKMQLQHEVTT